MFHRENISNTVGILRLSKSRNVWSLTRSGDATSEKISLERSIENIFDN